MSALLATMLSISMWESVLVLQVVSVYVVQRCGASSVHALTVIKYELITSHTVPPGWVEMRRCAVWLQSNLQFTVTHYWMEMQVFALFVRERSATAGHSLVSEAGLNHLKQTVLEWWVYVAGVNHRCHWTEGGVKCGFTRPEADRKLANKLSWFKKVWIWFNILNNTQNGPFHNNTYSITGL